MKSNLDGSLDVPDPILVVDERRHAHLRSHALLTTVAMFGAVGAPLSGAAALHRDGPDAPRDTPYPRQGDPCPKCKRGKVRGGRKRFDCTRYCHRCGWFITNGQVLEVAGFKR